VTSGREVKLRDFLEPSHYVVGVNPDPEHGARGRVDEIQQRRMPFHVELRKRLRSSGGTSSAIPVTVAAVVSWKSDSRFERLSIRKATFCDDWRLANLRVERGVANTRKAKSSVKANATRLA
jgi:hypothetical protein